jgi:hypothetical protein
LAFDELTGVGRETVDARAQAANSKSLWMN